MLASLSMNDLNWQHTIINNHQIVGRTKVGMFTTGEQVSFTVNENNGIIESASMQWNPFSRKRNEKNIQLLQEYMRLNRKIYSPEQLSELFRSYFSHNKGNYADHIVLTKGNFIGTYSLIAINVLVFIAMVASGVSFTEPNVMDIYHWGGNIRIYTLGGEWWRVITSNFVHIGFVHLFLNMYALFFVGRYLEPIINKWLMIILYLCTGIFASLVSIWWTGSRISAGASGAIFGLYGTFIALLTTNLIDSRIRFALLQSFLIFVVYSLFSGMQPGIDNAAHLGGLLSGALFGYCFYAMQSLWRPFVITGIVVMFCTLSLATFYLVTHRTYKAQMIELLSRFSDYESKALNIRKGRNYKSVNVRISEMNNIAAPSWKQCSLIIDSLQKLPLDTLLSQQKISLLKQYINARIEENEMMIAAEKNNQVNTDSLGSIRERIHDQLTAIGQLQY